MIKPKSNNERQYIYVAKQKAMGRNLLKIWVTEKEKASIRSHLNNIRGVK